MSAELTIRLGTPSYPVLDAYRRDRSRVAIIMGPLGSGKTYGSIQRILQTIAEQAPNRDGVRPTRWLAVRNTYPDLSLTTIKDFQAIFTPRFGEMKMGGLEPPTFRGGFWLPDGTRTAFEVIFLALDREDAVKKIRGTQVTGVWLNETKELVKPVIDMLDLRHGRYPRAGSDGGVNPTWHGMIGDTNAWDEDHWLWRLAEEQTPDDWRFFRQPGGVVKVDGRWVANPNAENLRNLPEGYYIRGLQGKADDWISVNLANEYGFTLDGKPVHPEYVDSVHCTREPIPFDPALPILLGVDYGRTPAAAIGQYIPQWGRTVIIDEFVTEDMSAADFGPALKRYLLATYHQAQVKGWGDPAGDAKGQATNDTPRQVLVAAGVPVLPAPSNEPILRRAAVSRPLTRLCADGKPAMLISPKAKRLRKGLAGGFCYRRMKVAGDERYTDEPDKNMHSHICEAAEYLLLGLGEGQAATRRADYDDAGDFQEMADPW